MIGAAGRSTSALALLVWALLLGACNDDRSTTTAGDTTTTSSAVSTSGSGSTLAPTTTAPASTSTTPAGPVPGRVTFVLAGPAGGSGEIELDWEGVADATGYRVYRSSSAEGPFVLAADVNVSTGTTTLGDGVTNLWSPPADFPPFTTVPGVEPPPHFQYVEVVTDGVARRHFQVVAYNAFGEGAASPVVCGAPTGEPTC